MTNPNLNLTNQELIKELQSRIETGNLEAQVTADHQTQTCSLLSKLGSKEWLLLIGSSVAFMALIFYSLKATNYPVTDYTIELSENNNPSYTLTQIKSE